ncbi:MAG: hypothetical protein ABI577_02245 [bacterium]
MLLRRWSKVPPLGPIDYALLPPDLGMNAPEPVRAALARFGRSEDLRFSPNNGLLAIAGFSRQRILILRIQIGGTPEAPTIVADDFIEMQSSGIGLVHGLDFIDDNTLVVANRDGGVSIIRVPEGPMAGRECEVAPIGLVRGARFRRIHSPGSIAAVTEPGGEIGLLICNNYRHRVTRHVVSPSAGYRETEQETVFKRRLNVPDGIARSHDGAWVAVSSHGTHDVKLFGSGGERRHAEPAGELRSVGYPHGLRFTGDDRYLLVADAGAPLVHVYERGDTWAGVKEPIRSIVVLEEAVFLRGHSNREEGGPKGLDIDRSNRVVLLTCEEQALAVFPLAAFIGQDAAEQAGALFL